MIGLTAWEPYVQSRAQYAQSTVRRFQRWLNNEKIVDGELAINENLLIHKRFLIIRRGKKHFAGIALDA